MKSPQTGGIDLSTLLDLFPGVPLLDRHHWVSATEVPEPYRTLLVHPRHMTVAMEKFHGDRVGLRIIDRARQGDRYARMILLALEQTARIVQFGIMRFDFRFCEEAVRDEILGGQTPLGRILIEHNVMREIHPQAYMRISTGSALMEHFGITESAETYGRVATILCNGEPAVEVLEVSTPLR